MCSFLVADGDYIVFYLLGVCISFVYLDIFLITELFVNAAVELLSSLYIPTHLCKRNSSFIFPPA